MCTPNVILTTNFYFLLCLVEVLTVSTYKERYTYNNSVKAVYMK